VANEIGSLSPLNLRATPDIIAELVRNKILEGVFEPGVRVSEPQLAQQLGVSRGPVREALQRLVQEGLLTNTPHKGVCVVDLGVDDVVDIYKARCAIEKEAATRLFQCKDPLHIDMLRAVISEMELAVRADDGRAVLDCDSRFHTALVMCLGSKRLNRMFSTLRAETFISLSKLLKKRDDLHEFLTEHAQLLALIEGDSLADLLSAIDQHFCSVLASVKKV